MAAENPALWDKPDEMQKINKEKSLLTRAIEEWETYDKKLKDAKTLLEMSEEAQDEPTFQEAKNEVIQIEELGKGKLDAALFKKFVDGNEITNEVMYSTTETIYNHFSKQRL